MRDAETGRKSTNGTADFGLAARAAGLARRSIRTLAQGPLLVRSFALLVAGQFTSGIGDMCYAIALPWLILSNHGGAAELGLVIGCYGVTRAGGIPLGGFIADQVGARRVMITADSARCCLTGALGALAITGHPSLLILVGFSLLHGGCGGAFIPASQSIMPTLLAEEQLAGGNSMFTVITQASGLIGPAIGGALVATVGSGPALIVDAATFAVSAATLVIMRTNLGSGRQTAGGGKITAQPSEHDRSSRDTPSFATVLRHGRLLHACIGAAFLLNLFLAGTMQVALPSLAHQEFGAGGYGVMLVGLSAGATLGALGARVRLAANRPTFRVAVVTVLWGLAIGALPWAGGLPGATVCLAIVGAADSISGIEIVSMLQVWSPGPVLGRVLSSIMFGVMGLYPISVVVSGILVHSIGIRAFFPLAGVVTLAAIAVAAANPAFRSYRTGDRFTYPEG